MCVCTVLLSCKQIPKHSGGEMAVSAEYFVVGLESGFWGIILDQLLLALQAVGLSKEILNL